ncbi:MAG: ATP-binding protein [Paenisporosarcina sp.]|nr:ATP-binding protein [Paenisporosarcina sp.]
MTSLIRDIFLNVSLSITIITLWKFFSQKNINSDLYQKSSMALAGIISILLCLVFPLDFYGKFDFHFLHIPIGIIGLYGGAAVSSIMLIVAFPLVFLFADRLELAIILLVVQTVVNIIMSNYFLKWKTNMKIVIGTLLTTIISVILLATLIVQNPGNNSIVNFALGILCLQIISVAFYFYLIETFKVTQVSRESLIKAEKMQGLYHLAAAFGHEIRQPLTISKGMLQLLTEGKWPADKQQEFLLASIAEINRDEKIIKNYQIFAEPYPSKSERFDLVNEIQQVISLIEPITDMNNIQIQSNLSSAWINGDKAKVEQCLIHICTNAMEAMESGGCLTIRSKNINGKSVIEISDTGIGMTKKQITRLGEPFFSLTDQKGTGLGMMVVFRIVESMGGKLEIDSEVGKGTNVKIIFT